MYAALTRPDFQAVSRSASSAHFGALVDRLNLAIESVENARELLVGSFDMFTTQTTLCTNEVIKVLTLVSAVLFPASVVVGVSGLQLRPPVDPRHSAGFWGMLCLIALIALITVAVARWRKWI